MVMGNGSSRKGCSCQRLCPASSMTNASTARVFGGSGTMSSFGTITVVACGSSPGVDPSAAFEPAAGSTWMSWATGASTAAWPLASMAINANIKARLTSRTLNTTGPTPVWPLRVRRMCFTGISGCNYTLLAKGMQGKAMLATNLLNASRASLYYRTGSSGAQITNKVF